MFSHTVVQNIEVLGSGMKITRKCKVNQVLLPVRCI